MSEANPIRVNFNNHSQQSCRASALARRSDTSRPRSGASECEQNNVLWRRQSECVARDLHVSHCGPASCSSILLSGLCPRRLLPHYSKHNPWDTSYEIAVFEISIAEKVSGRLEIFCADLLTRSLASFAVAPIVMFSLTTLRLAGHNLVVLEDGLITI